MNYRFLLRRFWTVTKLMDAIASRASEPVRQRLAERELRQVLREALARHTERQQTVLGLHYFEGMTPPLC